MSETQKPRFTAPATRRSREDFAHKERLQLLFGVALADRLSDHDPKQVVGVKVDRAIVSSPRFEKNREAALMEVRSREGSNPSRTAKWFVKAGTMAEDVNFGRLVVAQMAELTHPKKRISALYALAVNPKAKIEVRRHALEKLVTFIENGATLESLKRTFKPVRGSDLAAIRLMVTITDEAISALASGMWAEFRGNLQSLYNTAKKEGPVFALPAIAHMVELHITEGRARQAFLKSHEGKGRSGVDPEGQDAINDIYALSSSAADPLVRQIARVTYWGITDIGYANYE